ncbi:MAG TPA: flagellar biosynthesis protein FlhA [Patescibacteria group bacterium]|nr:flagellar biosynthesis protein FlhA [Patescibacteria group bacterium]
MAGTGVSTLKSNFRLRGDVIFAFGIVTILVVLVLPMPAWLLDASLALSLAFSVLILMTVLFIEKPLELSSFPTILLVATMIRLALNLASTRLILAHGHEGKDAAGHVIEAFGSFVMQDNFVIGVIVFAILTIVNFVVITKGAGRIAEVAARFSLDAMPGKQMAIDADLSAGMIDEKEARFRRSQLEQESTFFGAMDGAAKFVRGDAIAGLLIVFINVVAGMVIGVVQKDLSAGDAASFYTHLTIGDGLVSQIPALIVSIASGMLVSKAGVSGSAEKAVFAQLSNYPQAMIMSAVLMAVLAAIPGIPAFPFLIMAATAGVFAYNTLETRKKTARTKVADEEAAAAKAPVAEEPISKALAIDTIRVELGYGLLPLVNNPEKGRLTEQIKGLRRQLAEDMGFILPSVRIQDNLQLPANSYVVRIKEIEAGKGDIRPDMLLCMNPTGDKIELPGESTREPTFGLPAMWISPDYREEAHFRGYTVVDPATVVTTHITEVIKDNMPDLLSYAETQKLLDELPKSHQKLVADVIPTKITVTGLQRVLQNLVSERISIRDLPTILEGVAEATGFTSNVTMITEHVRARLARQICDQNSNNAGILPLVTLSGEWEQSFAEALIGQGEEKQLAMAPTRLQQFIQSVRSVYEDMAMKGESPVLLTSPGIRPYVRSIIERFRPQTIVMSQNEIHPRAKIRTFAQIT